MSAVPNTSLSIEPTGATLGAFVAGVSLANLDATNWQRILDAFHQYALLIFPAQHLDSAAQIAFGERFGRIEELAAGHKIVPISNKRADGTLLKDEENSMKILKGNEGWHTDSSYMRISALASVLSAHVVPTHGGETEWADSRAAYDALDVATRERLANLSAYHSLYYSQAKIGHVGAVGSSYGFHRDATPLRPLVKIHPVTGRPALYIGRHAHAIPTLTEAESEALLEELVTFTCRPPRTYLHRWQPGDVVIWDNRCVLHRARPYDHAEPRVMMHTRIAGDPVSELAAN
ncbi:MAG TPA: TauD/TfdA family dioxygenase [Pseudomonadales bacterium]|nr:TauD/TfdA family dioxygenase [Pseudomonadales bacterium]